MTSRKFFTLFLLCALVPLLAAKISLAMGWFSHSSTNKGEWLTREIQLLPNIPANAEHWRLAYVAPAGCDQVCEQALHTLQQLYIGLGRKQLNIKPLVLSQESPANLKHFPAIDWQRTPVPASELHNHIVIVNQHGLVLLRYPVTGDIESMRNTAKDIRTDLLKLMNYDRSDV